MTVRKRNKNENATTEEVNKKQENEMVKDEDAKEYPPDMTSDFNKKSKSNGKTNNKIANNNGLLISIRLDVYHNLQNIRQTISSLTLEDIISWPLRFYNMFFDRTTHVDKSLKGICLFWFYLIVAMAFFTRFYKLTQPAYIW